MRIRTLSAARMICASAAVAAVIAALKAFDLRSAAPKASYLFPEGRGLCNDIAVARERATYAIDTTGNRILRLEPGATALCLG